MVGSGATLLVGVLASVVWKIDGVAIGVLVSKTILAWAFRRLPVGSPERGRM